MKGGKRYEGYLQEAVEGAYHTKHLEKGDTQKDSRGWGGDGRGWEQCMVEKREKVGT